MHCSVTRMLAGLLALALVGCEPGKGPDTGNDNSTADSPPEVKADTPASADDTQAVDKPRTSTSGTLKPKFFLPLTIPEALQQARDTDKIVFAYFHTNSCPGCQIMDGTVFADPRVVRLLRRHTVPVEVNIRDHPVVAVAYMVMGVPACVFLRADGSQIERIEGATTTDTFLTLASNYVTGLDDVAAMHEQVLYSHVELARTLASKEKYDQALQEYLWVWDRGSRDVPEFISRLGMYLLSDLFWLAESHPPAKDAVEDRYQAAKERLLDGAGTSEDLQVVVVTNRLAGRSADTLAVYDQIKKEHPDDPLLPQWGKNLFDAFLEARRYSEIDANGDLGGAIDRLFADAAVDQPKAESYVASAKYDAAIQEHNRRLANRAANYYQVFVGLERQEAADALAARLLETAPGAQTLNALAWAGYLTGKPSEKHLAQARQASKLTGGRSVAILDTLARILAVLGQHEEAVTLIRDALDIAHQPREIDLLKETLEYVEHLKTEDQAAGEG